MYNYTLAFIIRDKEVLMVNREKQPWKGCWNGLGGKIKSGETALLSIKRELKEETHIDFDLKTIEYKGEVTWNSFDAMGQGLYLFLISVDKDFDYQTPRQTLEGILDWKSVDWVIDQQNLGVAYNIPYFLESMINDEKIYRYQCEFEENRLLGVIKEAIF
jgi:8-oxo-dGTP diphosphatase